MSARILSGKRILVTRARKQGISLSSEIKVRGGIPIEMPVIRLKKASDQEKITAVLHHLKNFQWVVFTSANGVHFFFQALHDAQLTFPESMKTAVVGEKTGKVVKDYGITAHLTPDEYIAEALLESLKKVIRPGQAILMPRGNLARKMLVVELRAFGCHVRDLVVYETVPNLGHRKEIQDLLFHKKINIITLMSSSAARYFSQMLGSKNQKQLLEHVKIACVGPVTAKEAEANGLPNLIIAKEYTASGLLDAIEQQERGNPG